jgi:hypothetical protein
MIERGDCFRFALSTLPPGVVLGDSLGEGLYGSFAIESRAKHFTHTD